VSNTDGERVFFVHVMKTGGSTLKEALRATLDPAEVYPGQDDLTYREPGRLGFRHFTIAHLMSVPDERRRRIRLYMGHFPYVVRDLLGGDLVTLSVLRHPVERTISLLRQLKRGTTWVNATRRLPMSSLTLEEIYEHERVYPRLIRNHQTKIFSMTLADQPEGYMQVIDIDEARLAHAKDNLAALEVLGLTERYDDFLDDVAARFGWHVGRDVRLNEAPPGEAPISDAFRRRIADDNAIDIDLYEHARALVDERRRAPKVVS
jgi:hypothetical protein